MHIGFNKTATTMLQEEVFWRHPQITYLGRPYRGLNLVTSDGANGGQIIEEAIRAVRMQDTLNFDARRVRQNVARVLGDLKSVDRPVVLSDEGLTNARFNDRRIIAERLRDLFGPCNIIATIRDQLTCIPSLYFFLVRKNLVEESSFDSWLEQQLSQKAGTDDAWTLRQFKYAEIFSLYREIFPEGKIAFIPYELLVKDIAAFAFKVANSLGVDPGVTLDRVSAAKTRNAVGSIEAARAIRGFERLEKTFKKLHKNLYPAFLLSKSMPSAWGAKEALRHTLTQRVESRSRGKFKMRESSKEILSNYFAADNARLCDLIDYDLSTFGYPILRQKILATSA